MESRDISLLQNYLSVAFEPGCLAQNCLGRLRGTGISASMAVRIWAGEPGEAGTTAGAELGLCWGSCIKGRT